MSEVEQSVNEARYILWEECFRLRESCRHETCESRKLIQEQFTSVNTDINDKMEKMYNRLDKGLDGVNAEMKELRNSVNTFNHNFLFVMIGFCSTLIGSIIALFWIFVK